MKCEKCGKETDYLCVDTYIWDGDGGDTGFLPFPVTERGNGTICMEMNRDWMGYGLSGEERPGTIFCPNCRKFPLESREIQVYETVRVVLFGKGHEEEKKDRRK